MKITKNTYKELFIDITGKCNQNCNVCYSKNLLKSKDISLDYFKDVCALLTTPTDLIFVGGEPTLHPKLFDLIEIANNMDHTVVLSTNGKKFAEDKEYTKEFSKIKGKRTRLNLDVSGGKDSRLYEIIMGKDLYLQKIRCLDNFKTYGIGKVMLSCILIKFLNESVIPDILSLADEYKQIVRFVKFRSQSHNSSYLTEGLPLSTDDIRRLLSYYIPIEKQEKNVVLDGRTEPKCEGKTCCYHFMKDKRLMVCILECFTEQGLCWRKGRLNDDYTIDEVFDSYRRLKNDT